MSRISILAITLAVAAAASFSAAADPVPFRAVYKARFKGFPIGATGIRELRKLDDDQYVLTSVAYNFLAKISEQTTFKLDENDDIVPMEYQYHRTGVGRNKTTIQKFDWDRMQASTSVDSRSTQLTIPNGTQDKLSYQFKLCYDLTRAYKHDEAWRTLSYNIDDDGELKSYSFRVVGKEVLKTPAGEIKTVKATRTDGNPDRVTNFWLAPDYDFMLVKFEQTEPDGKGFYLLLRQAEFNGKEIGR